MSGHATGSPTPRRGFTLVEMAVVLTITVIGALLVVPRWSAPLTEAENGATSDERASGPIVRLLREARHQAIRQRQVVTVRFDVAHRTVRVDTAGIDGSGVWYTAVDIPPRDVQLAAARDVAVAIFHPSGAAIADPLRLRHDGSWVTITVEPWSGEVRDVAR